MNDPLVQALTSMGRYVQFLNDRSDYIRGRIEIEEFESRVDRYLAGPDHRPTNDFQVFSQTFDEAAIRKMEKNALEQGFVLGGGGLIMAELPK